MNTKKIAHIGIGIALYVVLSFAVKIPLIGHIQTDLGYVAFGAYLYLMGVTAIIVGVAGCIIESLIFSGWFPFGWALGQLLIGIICAWVFTRIEKKAVHILAIIVSVFIGIVIVKSVVECTMFGIPYAVKIPKNTIAWIADTVPMIIGLLIGYRLKSVIGFEKEEE